MLAFQISLVETNWIYEDVSGRNPDLLEFLVFLTDVTQISFTADFTVVRMHDCKYVVRRICS